MTEAIGPDPYDAVLADLRAKRDQIDSVIAALNSLRAASLSVAAIAQSASGETTIAETAGMYLGMSITDATKKLLALRKRTMGNADIARELQAGGLAMTSKDPVNTVGSVLTRRFHEVGDVVKVGRGVWGLKEWYPGRTFKPASKQSASSTQVDGVLSDVPDSIYPLIMPNPPESGYGS